jgi:hypothetical protein
MVRRRQQRRPDWCVHPRWALVALGEEPERVNLLDEVCNAGPAAEFKADHQDPSHYEHIHHEHPRPARQEGRGLLYCVLQKKHWQLTSWAKIMCARDSKQISVTRL